MKKLRTIEITKKDANREDPMELGSYYFAKDLYRYRAMLCAEANCENHYEIVQVKVVDGDDDEPIYGVIDTAKNRLI